MVPGREGDRRRVHRRDVGTSGDVDYLISLIERNGFKKEVVSELELARDNWTVHYYVFRLTTQEQNSA